MKSAVSRVVVEKHCTGELGAELAMGRAMTSQRTCRLGAQRLTIAPWRESQDPTVTFGGLGLVQAQDNKPKCQVFGQRRPFKFSSRASNDSRRKQPTTSWQ